MEWRVREMEVSKTERRVGWVWSLKLTYNRVEVGMSWGCQEKDSVGRRIRFGTTAWRARWGLQRFQLRAGAWGLLEASLASCRYGRNMMGARDNRRDIGRSMGFTLLTGIWWAIGEKFFPNACKIWWNFLLDNLNQYGCQLYVILISQMKQRNMFHNQTFTWAIQNVNCHIDPRDACTDSSELIADSFVW